MSKMNRRQFVQTTAAAAAVPATLFGQAPAVKSAGAKPCVVASNNGNKSKDEHGVTCVAKAFDMMTKGSDVLDALVAGVAIVELDPDQNGVGWSGLRGNGCGRLGGRGRLRLGHHGAGRHGQGERRHGGCEFHGASFLKAGM